MSCLKTTEIFEGTEEGAKLVEMIDSQIPAWLREKKCWSLIGEIRGSGPKEYGPDESRRSPGGPVYTLEELRDSILRSGQPCEAFGDDCPTYTHLKFHPPHDCATLFLKFAGCDYPTYLGEIPKGAFVVYHPFLDEGGGTAVVLQCSMPEWNRFAFPNSRCIVTPRSTSFELYILSNRGYYVSQGPEVEHGEYLAPMNRAYAEHKAAEEAKREAEQARFEARRKAEQAEREAKQRAEQAERDAEARRKYQDRISNALASFGFCESSQLGAVENPIEPLIDGILYPGEPAVLSGPAKSFKSHIAAELAVSVADGARAFGSFPEPSNPGAVMLVASEFYSELALKTCIDKVRAARGVSNSGRLITTTQPFDFGSEADVDELCRVMKAKWVRLLVVDPIYDQADGMTEAELSELARTIRRICSDTGAAVLIVCHTTRGNGKRVGALPSLGDVKGPIFEKLARGWLLVNEAKRFKPGAGQVSLNLVTGHYGGHSASYLLEVAQGGPDATQWVTRLTDKSAQPAASAGGSGRQGGEPSPELTERVLAYLADGEIRSKSAIARGVRASNAKTEPVLVALVAAGSIEPAKPARGATGYCLSATKCLSHSPT